VFCLIAVLRTAAVTGFPGGCGFPNGWTYRVPCGNKRNTL